MLAEGPPACQIEEATMRLSLGTAALAIAMGTGGLGLSAPAFADGMWTVVQGSTTVQWDRRDDGRRDGYHDTWRRDHRRDDDWRRDDWRRDHRRHDDWRGDGWRRDFVRYCSPHEAYARARRMGVHGIRLSGRGNGYFVRGWRYGHPVQLVIGKQPGCPVFY